MSNPYLGEIRMFAGNYAPVAWALCQGQQLYIPEFTDLYGLIGTTYGGDGVNYFKLPDLQSRIPIHPGASYPLASTGGYESVRLTSGQLPAHRHALTAATTAGSSTSPSGNVWAPTSESSYTSATSGAVSMSSAALSAAGGGQAHDNMPPFVAVNFIISLFGTYPTGS